MKDEVKQRESEKVKRKMRKTRRKRDRERRTNEKGAMREGREGGEVNKRIGDKGKEEKKKQGRGRGNRRDMEKGSEVIWGERRKERSSKG